MKHHKEELDAILWRHISSLPYFRGFLRAIEDLFYQDIELTPPVLDLGSGDGHFASVAFDKKLDVGLDPWISSTKEASKRDVYRLLVIGEGAEVPYEDSKFSTVISTSVLEHILNVEAVLLEVSRVIKPGGLFVFCGPNHRFTELLWGRRLLEKLGLKKAGKQYARFFNWISRHQHTDHPDIWKERLSHAGFDLEDSWHYFPPRALHILEWGHLFGLPSLVMKFLFKRWILVPTRWNLVIPWKLTRKFLDHPRAENGVCTFYLARKLTSAAELPE